MPASLTVRRCARCGTPQEEAFRFCPECGLPTRVEPILSTQIGAARQAAEGRPGRISMFAPKRLAVFAAVSFMGLFVVGLGLILFNQSLLDRVVPAPPAPDAPPEVTRQNWEPVWVPIHAGKFVTGPPGADGKYFLADSPEYQIAKYEVPNSLWREFLVAEAARLQADGVWQQAVPRSGAGGDGWEPAASDTDVPHPEPDELYRPVRYVTPMAIAYFCDWATKRLGDPGWRLRTPTRDEWEYAAREGTRRAYPWGDQFWVEAPAGTGGGTRPIVRVGEARPSAVWNVEGDRTPKYDIVGLGSNVEELVLSRAPADDETMTAFMQSPFKDVFRCGAGFASGEQAAAELAKAWNFDRTLDAGNRFPELGLRLVKVKVGR